LLGAIVSHFVCPHLVWVDFHNCFINEIASCTILQSCTEQIHLNVTQRLQDEIDHVELLRTALGDDAVDQPAIDIGGAFAAAADAALNTTLDPSFTPYGNDILFYHGAFIFEDVGVTAYKVLCFCVMLTVSAIVVASADRIQPCCSLNVNLSSLKHNQHTVWDRQPLAWFYPFLAGCCTLAREQRHPRDCSRHPGS
jgi:hypothetical protein